MDKMKVFKKYIEQCNMLSTLLGEFVYKYNLEKVEYSGDKIINRDGKDYIMCYGLKGHKSIKDMVVKFPNITQKKSVVMGTLKDAEEFDRSAKSEMKYAYIDERIVYLIGAMESMCRKMSYYFA